MSATATTKCDAWFRALGWLEATSLVLLYFVAMPLKYGLGVATAVRLAGGVHGALFTVYVITAILQARKYGWSRPLLAWAMISANLPLGCVFFDASLKRELWSPPR